MKNTFRQIVKEYFNFSKKDRNGVIFLGVMILLVIVGHVIVANIRVQTVSDYSAFEEALEAWDEQKTRDPVSLELFDFDPNSIPEEKLDSLDLPADIKKNIVSYRLAGGTFREAAGLRKIYGMDDSIFNAIEPFVKIEAEVHEPRPEKKQLPEEKLNTGSFDPNKAGEEELASFGFNPRQLANLIKYRESGGSFSRPSDVLKIYGIDSVFYLTIEDNILIEESKETETETREKNEPPLLVELNRADSVGLTELRGVGPVFAGRILKYRDLLGGFYSKKQLLEVYNFPEETFRKISPSLQTDTLLLEKIRINFADFSELVRHPYFTREHASAILDYRNQNGPYKSPGELLAAGLVDSTTFREIKPYLSCR